MWGAVESLSPPPSIAKFVAEPNQIQAGQTVTLIWRAENATEVRIEGLSAPVRGKLNGQGLLIDRLPRTVQYTLTASGSGQAATATATVLVTK